jgi:hypothetical protein
MADLVDKAQAQQEGLEEARQRFGAGTKNLQPAAPEATGFCLNCGIPLKPVPGAPVEPRWCGAECRDDWEWFDAHCQ